MATRWVMVEKGSRKIVADGKTKSACVNKAQNIINRNPHKQYRYMKLTVDPTLPWFKKGE